MSDDYEVGYGKPPKGTRFRKGRSGNPKGRRKGTKNLKTDLQEVLQEKIVIVEGEERKVVSKQRAILMTLANRGIKGDTRAALALSGLVLRLHDQSEAGSEEDPLDAGDLAIIESFTKKALGSGPPQGDEPGSSDEAGGSDDAGGDSGDTPPAEDPS